MNSPRRSKQVKVIPPTKAKPNSAPAQSDSARRVAAYARVSTNDVDQRTSYNNQVSYYTQYIQEHEGWEFAGMFTDEGITGTSTRHRDGFNAMIAAAMEGRIDLIITKSISRFARNTVDTLTTVRKLKERGVEVFFEKENIFTLDSKGELLITIMSSLAQEESRSISENVTWGMRKRFADGKVLMPYTKFLGYRKGANGLPEIVPEEAEVVRYIYRTFMEGKAPSYIARDLTARGILSPGGKSKWYPNTVASILSNEKYKGDALLQKTFCTDFLTKTFKTNEGEVPQYYVEHSHPAIIDPALFDAVQIEIKHRRQPGRRNYTPHIFSGKIYCAECGSKFGSNSWRDGTVWKCNAQRDKITTCKVPVLRNNEIRLAFVEAFNRVLDRKAMIIRICMDTMSERCNVADIEYRLESLQSELTVVTDMLEGYLASNAHIAMDQEEYKKKFSKLEKQHVFVNRKVKQKGSKKVSTCQHR